MKVTLFLSWNLVSESFSLICCAQERSFVCPQGSQMLSLTESPFIKTRYHIFLQLFSNKLLRPLFVTITPFVFHFLTPFRAVHCTASKCHRQILWNWDWDCLKIFSDKIFEQTIFYRRKTNVGFSASEQAGNNNVDS